MSSPRKEVDSASNLQPRTFAGSTTDSQHIRIRTTQELGRGSNGVVRDTEIISVSDSQKQPTTQFVVKTLLATAGIKQRAVTEHKIAAQLYPPTPAPLTERDGTTHLFMERVPGEQLSASITSKLPIHLQLLLITQLVSQVSILHHSSPRAPAPTVHGDIKPQNIKIHTSNDKNGSTTATLYLFDFGLSNSYEEKESPDSLKKIQEKGNQNYFAPETLTETPGSTLATDIYMMAVPIAVILGNTILDANISKDPWTGIPKLPNISPDPSSVNPNWDLNTVIAMFLQNMRFRDYAFRPNIDEVLMFFNTLQTLFAIHEKKIPSEPNTQENLMRKLWFICYGIFRVSTTKIANYIIENTTSRARLSDPEGGLQLCAKIATLLDRQNLFDHSFGQKLLQNSDKIVTVVIPLVLETLPRFTQGTLETCRANALELVESLLAFVRREQDVVFIKEYLDKLAKSRRIDYLYKQKGMFGINTTPKAWGLLQKMIKEKQVSFISHLASAFG